MGNWFQRIVVSQASHIEAEQIGGKIRENLIQREIIQPELRDCVLSADGMGYPPGANYWQAVESPDPHLLDLQTNGFTIMIGRTVFDCGQGGFDLVCCQCHISTNVNNWGRSWGDAVTEWYEESGQGMLKCPYCRYEQPVNEWQYEPAIGFGNLGLEFWNWPPLTGNFMTYLSQQMGHDVLYVAGKL